MRHQAAAHFRKDARRALTASVPRFICLLALLAFAWPGAGARGAEGPLTLSFWNGFTAADGRRLQELVNDFNKANAGKVRVNMAVMPWSDFYSKVALSLNSRRGPDIGIVHYDSVSSVINQGIVMPLDPWLNQFPKDYIPSVWSVCREGEHQYGIPLDIHPMVLYWNKDIFRRIGIDPETPPASRAEFLRVCKLIKDQGVQVHDQPVYGCIIPTGWPNLAVWMHILFCNDGRMFDGSFSRAMYDQPAGTDALRFMAEMIYRDGYSPAHVGSYGESAERFARGTSAMTIDGSWMLNSFTAVKGLDFGTCSMINLGRGTHRVWASSHVMVLFNKSKQDPRKIAAGIRFLRYLSDNSLKWSTAGMIPARRSIVDSAEFKAIPHMAGIARDLDKIRFPECNYRYFEGTETLTEQINMALLGKLTPEAALRKATEETNRKLSQDPD